MSSLSFPLSLNPPFTNYKSLSNTTISPYTYKTSFQSLSKSYICFSISSPNSNFEREESRWLREEQRWLREEQRWIREESRWRNEREALLGEIETLRSKIEELEKTSDRNLNVRGVLQVLRNEVSRIAERGSSAVPLVVERLDVEAEDEVEEEVEVEDKEVVRVFENEEVEVKEVVRVFEKEDEVKKKKRITLRKGSEGDDVRIMQEALQKLGFYCGEEDEEYSMFSSGTERAIKTWQASLRIPEDGIMTPELLEKLFGDQKNDVSGLTQKVDTKRTDVTSVQKESNGAAASHTTEVPGIQKRDAKEKGVAESKVPHSRVFLLGENRWEDSSRLIGRNKQDGGSINTDTTRCISCRGEGRLLCSECDGTGEPNIEEQFMEWVDEGAKCPYCNGVGFEICDVCNGKTVS